MSPIAEQQRSKPFMSGHVLLIIHRIHFFFCRILYLFSIDLQGGDDDRIESSTLRKTASENTSLSEQIGGFTMTKALPGMPH